MSHRITSQCEIIYLFLFKKQLAAFKKDHNTNFRFSISEKVDELVLEYIIQVEKNNKSIKQNCLIKL